MNATCPADLATAAAEAAWQRVNALGALVDAMRGDICVIIKDTTMVRAAARERCPVLTEYTYARASWWHACATCRCTFTRLPPACVFPCSWTRCVARIPSSRSPTCVCGRGGTPARAAAAHKPGRPTQVYLPAEVDFEGASVLLGYLYTGQPRMSTRSAGMQVRAATVVDVAEHIMSLSRLLVEMHSGAGAGFTIFD